MDFPASLEYLYGLQRFGVKLGLDNMRALQQRLPELQRPLSTIHVAGTNGKGSVSNFLAEILTQQGYRVGLYTSPHLHCFSERIRLNRIPLAVDEIAALADIVRTSSSDIPLTFFEATTAMALLAFARAQVDFAVIETGLGGRLDATNVITPMLCMITPISFDHGEHLGTSLAEIATEKAGIIKTGVPVVVGSQPAEARTVVLETAITRTAEVWLAHHDFSWHGNHEKLSVEVKNTCLPEMTCAMAGTHQLDNFAQAVAGSVALREQGVVISDQAIGRAGKNATWPGRLEWWGENHQLLLDASHNQAGILTLNSYLAGQKIDRIHLVTGLSGERSPETVLMPLVKNIVSLYAVPVSFDRSVTPQRVVEWAHNLGLTATAFDSAPVGLASALAQAGPDETVVVCGSLYLVAELREMLLTGGLAAIKEVADIL